MAGNGTIEITDDNFDAEVLQSDIPVLIDFWAEWCAPCRMLTPTIEALAKEYEGRIKVGKLNTEDARDTAAKYQIRSIPTVMLFRNGEVINQFVGVQPKERFVEELDKALDSPADNAQA